MAKKSAAELSVVPVTGAERPEPPDCLTEDESREWRAIVHRLPVDWFPTETHRLLVQYLRHNTKANQLAKLIERYDVDQLADGGVQEFKELLNMQEKETRAMVTVARSLRLTNQSRYTPDKASTRSRGGTENKPWLRKN